MRIKALFTVTVAALFLTVACGKEEAEKAEPREAATYEMGEGSGELPSGHPPLEGSSAEPLEALAGGGHPEAAAPKEVRVSDEVKAKWKEVGVEVTDGSSGKTESLTIKVGETTALGDTGFKLRVEALLPDYTIFDDHVGSKSNDANNPAVLVELIEGESGVSKGWVFSRFPDFNSYKHDRFSVVLVAPATE